MSRRFRQFIAAAALALGPCAWAAEATLEEDLAPLVKTLSRPVDVFHWADATRAKHASYTRRQIEEGGLAAATDPLSTRRKGDEWILFRYTLPKNFRFVDVRAAERQPLPARSLERLRAQGCAAQNMSKLFAADAGPACRKIAAASAKALQADAVVVTRTVAPFPHCEKRLGSGFVIFDGTRFLPEGALVVPAVEAANPERIVASRAYVESSLFGCGTAEEDRYPDAESALAFDFVHLQHRFQAFSKQLAKTLQAERLTDLSKAELRKEPVFEKVVRRDFAPDAEGVDSIQFFKFRGEEQFGLKWVDLKCQEDLPDVIPLPGENPECRKVQEQITRLADSDAFWAETRADFKAGRFKDRWYWHACWPRAEVVRRQARFCGMIAYPEPESLERRLKGIMKRVADYLAGEERGESPLRFALVTGRELAALRPFARDHAATSHRIVNAITERSDLPPLKTFPELFTPEERYIQHGLAAAADSLKELREKLRQLETEPGDK